MKTLLQQPPAAAELRAADLAPYVTADTSARIDLRLDANEGPVPPVDLASILARLAPEVLRRYPSAAPLEAQLAAKWGVTPERVLVCSGGDDAIDRACRACLGPGAEVILPSPTFEMIGRYARLAGARTIEPAWWTGPFPTDAVLESITPDTRMIVVVSPNNPTGAVASPEDLRRLAAAAPDATLLVDLAYAEFADEDQMQTALSLPRAVVVRTLSKAYGLAGLRVGYAIGPAALIRSMRAVGAPYPASALSLAVASDQLRTATARVAATVSQVRRERRSLGLLLEELGATPLESQANFVLAEFADADWVWSALRGLGIATRRFRTGTRLDNCLRISCPAKGGDFDRLCAALRAAARPRALLLDMDGVLADVSASYRTAIMQTAERLGARVTPEQIAAAKMQPDSNNDWVVSKRLLAAQGIDVPLETVAAIFNDAYRGRDGRPGLESTERLIPDLATLARLASRVKLGIVTGRPRRDAAVFLERFGLKDLIGCLVCMEDAPPKPSPEPLHLALRSLGVSEAWFVGDTPDDLNAARAAGVVPIGIAAPADASTAALSNAGAARVIESLGEVEELLP